MPDSAKKLAKLVEFESNYEANPTTAILQQIERDIQPVQESVDETQEGVIRVLGAVAELDSKKADRTEVQNAIDSIARIPGPRGFKGEKGDPGIGIKGDKGDTTIVEKVIERTEVIKEQPIVKTEIVKETTVKEDISGEELVKRVNKLEITPDKQIDAAHIKGLPQAMSKHYPVGVSETRVKALIAENPAGAAAFTDLTDTFSSYTGLGGQGLRVNATEDGIDTYTATDTDEKVKYDAGDPTAGYVADKFVAGTGISVAEGTGANENKLVITSTATESDTLDSVTTRGNTTNNDITVDEVTLNTISARTSAGGAIKSHSGTAVAEFGAGGGGNWTFEDGVKLNAGTADRILATDSSKNVQYLNTATYPSLTELSYVKGVTSGIQTQLGNKFDKTTDDTDDITDTATNRFTNDTDITRLANTSGTNTGDVSVTDSTEIDFTLTGQNITASLKSGSIDETKLDTSVNASLDLADTALQSFTETDPVFTASDFSGKSVVTTVGTPGTDTNIPTEQAVREAISASGGGDVTGPASSTDNGIVLFDGLTGKLIKDSAKTLSSYFEKAVDDTDDISVGTTNKFATVAEKTKLGHISVTQAVDLDTMESDIATNNAKVTNATHTGEVTGATTLTVDKTAISNRTGVTAATGDYVLIGDASDSDNLKKTTAQDIADLYTETDPVWVSEKGDYLNKTTNDTDDITEGTTNLFDKTVSITAGTGMSVSGTYPNFTVTNNVTDTGITQLTGDVTAGPGSGSQATTIATGAVTNTKIGTAAVTYDKIQHVIKERLLGRYSGTDGDVQEIQLGTGLSFSGDTLNTSSSPGSAVWGSISGDIEDQTDLATLIDNLKKCIISVNINGAKSADGSQSQIVAGTKTYVKIPYGGTVVGWVVTEVSASPQAGSIVIDVVKDTTANYPPTSGDSIAGTEKPTLTTQTNNSDTTLSTWTTSVAANDYLGFIVDSVDGCSNVLLQVLINKI